MTRGCGDSGRERDGMLGRPPLPSVPTGEVREQPPLCSPEARTRDTHTAPSADAAAGPGLRGQLRPRLRNRKAPWSLARHRWLGLTLPPPLSSETGEHLSVYPGVFTRLAQEQAASLGRSESKTTEPAGHRLGTPPWREAGALRQDGRTPAPSPCPEAAWPSRNAWGHLAAPTVPAGG